MASYSEIYPENQVKSATKITMEKCIEKLCWDDREIEIFRNEQSGLWSACIRKDDGLWVLGRNHKSRDEIVYELKFWGLAKRKPRKKLGNVAVG